jgi:hypothetical protein
MPTQSTPRSRIAVPPLIDLDETAAALVENERSRSDDAS